MTDDRKLRLLVHGRSPGGWNMAVDELLLEQAANEGIVTLRLYQWDAATLSLGYFQAYRDRKNHPASQTAPEVRRLTGGGALIHDRELTYSFALPARHPLVRDHLQLYQRVHSWFLSLLADYGISARLCGCEANGAECENARETPFLCFQRRSAFDVVVDQQGGGSTVKIIGSAQRRRRGAVLQHGALLLATSDAAPELPGVAEAQGRAIVADDAAQRVVQLAATELGSPLPARSLDLSESALVAELAEKYSGSDWLQRR